MREPIEDLYFNWLCAKVLDTSTRNYYNLAHILYSTEFVWIIPFDKHRVEDGIELRDDFLRETQTEVDVLWYEQPCSIFEVMVAFAKRASFQTDISVANWFKEFIINLRLDPFRVVSDSDVPYIHDILNTFMWRTYDPSGDGGLFPMRRTHNDQKEIEIWLQFCEYVDDRGLI